MTGGRGGLRHDGSAQDARAVAEGLLKMMRLAPTARAVMGQRGRAFVMAKHTYPVLAKRFLDALRVGSPD
jgi:hypothetical protein